MLRGDGRFFLIKGDSGLLCARSAKPVMLTVECIYAASFESLKPAYKCFIVCFLFFSFVYRTWPEKLFTVWNQFRVRFILSNVW